ncbi:MAG: hypothetical protein Q7V15_08335 [Phenylobacterium sp.]|uniref:hypothetical protein n=1 Tax=Phenylobacterium sp. TaxID=1871053 RepID=UPI0027243FDD|nr:hypothetical protein [Phenylobacterium sp.]MDO8901346.1 hypothetical protein [Phenylobacterium sp.]MDP2215175.1 hypothetical protein [Phenylobacterium sp.]
MAQQDQPSGKLALRNLTAIGGAIAAAAAVVVGVVLAFVFAATVVVVGLMLSLLVGLAAFAVRAGRMGRRKDKAAADDGIIEARHLGGHHWVAYGWNERA